MPAFLIGLTIAYLGLLAVVVTTHVMLVDPATGLSKWGWNYVEPMSATFVAVLTLQLVVLPVLTAWAVSEFVVLVRGTPRSLLRSATGPLGRTIRGFAVGLVGLCFVTLATIFAPELPDALTLIGAAALATFLPMMFARRALRGHCLACQFDLRGQSGGSVCPECGFDQFEQVSSPKKTRTPSSQSTDSTPPMIGLEATA